MQVLCYGAACNWHWQAPELTKLNEFPGPSMQEFAVWHCVRIVHVHQLQHQRPLCHDARATGQEVGANNCLQHRRLARTLREEAAYKSVIMWTGALPARSFSAQQA